MKKYLLLPSLFFASFSVSQLNALTIDFEGVTGFASTIGSYVDADGYRFTLSAGSNGNGFEFIESQTSIVEANTTKLFAANKAVVTMTKVGGGLFSMSGLDIGGSWINTPSRWADHVDVSDGSSTFTATLAGQGPTYVNLATAFTNVNSVTFTPTINAGLGVNDYEYTIDNIVVNESVPDTGTTLALLGLALAGLAVVRRRFA